MSQPVRLPLTVSLLSANGLESHAVVLDGQVHLPRQTIRQVVLVGRVARDKLGEPMIVVRR